MDRRPAGTWTGRWGTAQLIGLLCLLAIAAAVFARQSWRAARQQPYRSITASADPLRVDFNRDVDAVRIVMLVAPT